MLKPIKTEDQYNEALARVYTLIQKDVKENSDGSSELEMLCIIAERYESEHYSLSSPNALKPD